MDIIPSIFETEIPVYVIDTSGLIKLESTFPPDGPTFKGLWDEISYLISLRCFRIIDYVEKEINDYTGSRDWLKKWVAKNRNRFVYDTTPECFNAAIPIINEEYSTGFFDAKKQVEGKEEADPYLIAYCKINDFILITNESKTKPNRIPSIAMKNGVKYIDIYEFMRERGLRMERKNRYE